MRGALPRTIILMVAVIALMSCQEVDTNPSSTIGGTPPPPTSTTTTTAPPPTSTTQPASVAEPDSVAPPDSLVAEVDGLVVVAHDLSNGALDGSYWIGTINEGVSNRIVDDRCYWDAWYMTPPYSFGSNGVVLVTGDGILLCDPPDEARVLVGPRGILGEALIDGKRHLLVASENAIELLSLEDLSVDSLVGLPPSLDPQPASMSFGGGRFLVVTESGMGGIHERVRNLAIYDTDGDPVDLPLPTFSEGDDPHLAAAVISPDGEVLLMAEEFLDGSTDIVSWDLSLAEELARVRVVDAFVPPDDPFKFGGKFVSYLDSSMGRTLVGIATSDAEASLSGVILIDPDGTIHDISETDGFGLIGASFID